MALAYIGLGSNLPTQFGDPGETIRYALGLLQLGPGVEVAAVSTLRQTDPVGLEDQPRFTNGVAALETTFEPRLLLYRLLAVERQLGREREGPRFGPRTLDLDLLLYDDLVLDEPGLTIPHPRLHERRFALEPLADLAPGLVVPGHGRVRELLAGLD
jgi:2-amino-4-hydroxy-6-hydroxymethyldihydropteridine diphosphokinase